MLIEYYFLDVLMVLFIVLFLMVLVRRKLKLSMFEQTEKLIKNGMSGKNFITLLCFDRVIRVKIARIFCDFRPRL